ncbi:hypothetical protein IWQ61_001482 [Dispira simplex]|nr:hypothetical protein IWQ61_001482 [Dispira simplex]
MRLHSPPFALRQYINFTTIMSREYCVGDHVEYRPVEGQPALSTGVIKDVLVGPDPLPAGESDVKLMPPASRPRYVIENDETHKEISYKEDVIERLIRSDDV